MELRATKAEIAGAKIHHDEDSQNALNFVTDSKGNVFLLINLENHQRSIPVVVTDGGK